jgi:DNA-binding NarL/FixJ family response regulator
VLVDDTQHVRDMLSTMLSLDGFDVVGDVASGAEAIDIVPAVAPDVVVMDYKMPSMDGITATREILAKSPDVTVILYTAYLDDTIEKAAREAGVAACIGKVEGLSTLEHEISSLCLELMDQATQAT